MSQHLGSRVSALADGQLAPAAAERALGHVAGCTRCAGELAAARAARRALSCVDDIRPAGDLTARLLALGCGPGGEDRPVRPMTPFVPPSTRHATFTDTPVTATPRTSLLGGHRLGLSALGGLGGIGGQGALGGGQGGVLTGSVTPGRRGLRAVVGSVTGLGVVAAALFVLGDRPAVTPAAQNAEAMSLLGTAGTSALPAAVTASTGSNGTAGLQDGSSTADYLTWMRAQGWTCPTEVPDGWTVSSVRLRDEGTTLEVDLSGPVGDLVVTEQQGRLDTDALTAADRVTVADRTVYLLSTAPWHIAWQSGDTVVEVVSADSSSDVASVVAQFPESGFDSGLPARLTRGWDTLAAAVHLP
ncbi:MAG TPA: zf-HC2 domain-containing protein [Cellulomonas sp.]